MPVTPPNDNEFERIVRKRLVKRQETPKENNFKIGTKEVRGGYQNYTQKQQEAGDAIPVVGDNYKAMINQMHTYSPSKQTPTNILNHEPKALALQGTPSRAPAPEQMQRSFARQGSVQP